MCRQERNHAARHAEGLARVARRAFSLREEAVARAVAEAEAAANERLKAALAAQAEQLRAVFDARLAQLQTHHANELAAQATADELAAVRALRAATATDAPNAASAASGGSGASGASSASGSAGASALRSGSGVGATAASMMEAIPPQVWAPATCTRPLPTATNPPPRTIV